MYTVPHGEVAHMRGRIQLPRTKRARRDAPCNHMRIASYGLIVVHERGFDNPVKATRPRVLVRGNSRQQSHAKGKEEKFEAGNS